MDLNRLNKFVDSASKASSISKARSSFINEVKNLKEGYQSQLLEAREPITKLEEKRIQSQKKSDDERQDKLITQLQDNQRAITTELRDIKFDRQALLEELPGTAAIEHPDYKKAPHSAGVTPPPIPPRPWEEQTQIYDPDEIFPNYSEIYYEDSKGSKIGFPKPSDYLKMSDKDKKKVDINIYNAIKQWTGKSTTKERKKKDFAIHQKDNFIKYKDVLDTILKGQKHMKEKQGKGLRKYNQPKRNAYKIQNSSNRSPSVWHYGGLLVDYPKLMNNMLLDVYKNDKLVYQDKADKSLIDLLTKRYNPKTKYSIDAVRIFNDLNLLANMAKHKSSKKSNMIGSSLWLLPPAHGGSSLVDRSDPNKLAKRLEIIVGSLNAGNNSRILKNDLTLINNELYRIGAITKEMHDALIKKFLI